MDIPLFAALGFCALATLCWLISYRQLKQQQLHSHHLEVELARFSSVEQQVEDLKQQLQDKTQVQEQLQRAVAARSDVITELETRLESERQHHHEKLELQQQAKEALTKEFKQLAGDIFEEKTARFDQNSKSQLGHLLKPLSQQIVDFRRQVEESYHRESKDRQSLYTQIEQLKQLNQQMSRDAVNLTQALKGDSKVQGNWGEVILARLLEQSGLREGHEFETQSAYTQNGKRYLPDVIVHLPDNKDIVVDSKVSLVSYEQYCNSEDEEARKKYLQLHLQSLKSHIRGLSGKAYHSLDAIRSLDFVLLFVPVEGAFLLALEQQPELFEQAFEKNILLVSPSTLLVTLKTIHHIWRNEFQHQNAEEIARRGGELHDKFVGFIEVLDDLGKHIERSQNAYDTARKRLSTGRGNLVSQVVRLEQLGASANKKLTRSLVDAACESDLLEVKE